MTSNKILILSVRNVKKFFVVNMTSDISGDAIIPFGWLVRCYSKKGLGQKTYVCSDEELRLVKQNKISDPTFSPKLYDYVDIVAVNSISSEPKGSFLWLDSTPSLKTARCGLDSFDMALKQVGDEVIVDKTKFSFLSSSRNGSDYLSLEHRDQALLERDNYYLKNNEVKNEKL